MEDSYRKFFEDESTLREESLDKTKVYLRLIEALRGLDHLREVRGLLKDLREFVHLQSKLTKMDPQVEIKFLEVYQSILNHYLDEKEVAKSERKRKLFGFGKDPREEAMDKAFRQAGQLLGELKELTHPARKTLEEASFLLHRINRRLDELLENQQMDQKTKDKLKLIRERIS